MKLTKEELLDTTLKSLVVELSTFFALLFILFYIKSKKKTMQAGI